MDSQYKEISTCNDEINFYDYCKVIEKRKELIIGFVLISVIATIIANLFVPAKYTGEVVIKIGADGKITSKDLASSFQTPSRIGDINLSPAENVQLEEVKGIEDKLRIRVTAREPKRVERVLAGLIEDINNLPEVKIVFAQHKEKLSLRLTEISSLLKYSEEISKSLEMVIKNGQLLTINPIEVKKTISDLKVEKLALQHILTNYTGVTMLGSPQISKEPVKIGRKIVLAVIGSLLVSIFISFLMEYVSNIKRK